MDLAVQNNARFIIDRRGEPAVVVMSRLYPDGGTAT
jgi:hypothetical protein